MSWFVYENWTHKRARVHTAGCSYCNHGRGMHVSDSGRNGRWSRPFADRDLAIAYARSLRQPDTRLCAACM